MENSSTINYPEENESPVRLFPPDGMMWDEYGNPEFIEES